MSTLSFPLAATDFADLLCVRSVTFDDPENIEMSMTGAGEILTAELAPRLWRGTVDIHDLGHEEAGRIKSLVSTLRTPGRAFFVYNHKREYPFADPGGTILAAATPAIDSVNANNREIALKSLPAGYELRAGDLLGFTYGSSPVRYALHRVVEAVTADGSGDTAEFEVTPHVRPGAAADDAVTLIRPVCKAVMVPGSFSPGQEGRKWVMGMSFRWVQTLR